MPSLRTPTSEFAISDELASAMRVFRRVAVVTGRDDAAADRVRRIATEIAASRGWEMVLYDRSQERWSVTPHPTHLLSADERSGEGFAPLRQQLNDIEATGVAATAWIATVPALTAVVDLIQAVEIDAVFLPAEPDKPRIMERLLAGDRAAESVERAAHNIVPERNPYVLIVDDDEIRIETYEEKS